MFTFITVATLIVSCQGYDGVPVPIPNSSKGANSSTQDSNSTAQNPLPKAALLNTPPAVTSLDNYEVKVGGSDVIAYVHAIVEGRGCESAKYSEKESAITNPIKGTLSNDGEYTLCVKGVDEKGRVQEVATSHIWKIDRTVPAVSLSNPPQDFNTTDVISARVIGMNAIEYAWAMKIGKLTANECQGQEYSAYRPIADEISAVMTEDGYFTICLIGKSETGVTSLPAAHSWLQDRSAPDVVVSGLPEIWSAIPFDVTLIPKNRAQTAEIWVTSGADCSTKPANLNVRLFEASGAIGHTITAEDLKQGDCPATGTSGAPVCASELKTRRLCVETSKQGASELRKNRSSREWRVDLSNPLMNLVIKDSTKVSVTNKCATNRTATILGNSTKCPTTSTSLFLDISTPETQLASDTNLQYRTQFVAEGAVCPQDGNNWSPWSNANSKVFPLSNMSVTGLPTNPGKYTLCAQVKHSLKTLNAVGQIVWLDRFTSNITTTISTRSARLSAVVTAPYRYMLLDGASACEATAIMATLEQPRLPTTSISDALGTVQNKFFKLCLMADGQTVPTELVFFIDNVNPSLLVTQPAPFNNSSTVNIEFAAATSAAQYDARVDAVKFALVNFDATLKRCSAAPATADFKDLSAAGKGTVTVPLVEAEKNTEVRKCLCARDAAGNVGVMQEVKWNYDTTSPATPTVTGSLPAADGKDARTELVNLSISGTDIDSSRAIIIEGLNINTCPALPAAADSVAGPTIASLRLPNMNNTPKLLCVYGIDKAANYSTFQLKWTFDNTSPTLVLSGVPSADQKLASGATTTVSVTARAGEPSYLAISLFEEASAPADVTGYCRSKMTTATFGTVLTTTVSTGIKTISAPATSVYKIVCSAAKDAVGNLGVAGEKWKVTKE